MDRIQLRSLLMKMMLGCVILAAGLAVVTILIGEFTGTTGKALGTLFSALLHIAIVFGLVSMTVPRDEVTKRSSDFVINATMVIAILSFFTSVFGIWNVIEGEVAGKLYITYVVAMFVLLHVKSLFDIEAVYAKVKPYVYVNYLFVALVAALILGLVYLPERVDLISGFYGRLLAASAIVDVTIGVVIAVMHRLYIQQHPELQTKHRHQAFSGARMVLIVLFFFFVLWPLARFVFGSL